MDTWQLAHTVGGSEGAEIEMLSMGIAVLILAVFFRPSQVGRKMPMVVTALVGVALVVGSFIVPRL